MHVPPPHEFLDPVNFRSWSIFSWMNVKPSSSHNASNTALSLTASQGSLFSRKNHTGSKRINANNKALPWWLSLVVNRTGSGINSEASCWAHLRGIFLITLIEIRKCTLNMGSTILQVGRRSFWVLLAYLWVLLVSPSTLLTSSPSTLWLTPPSSTIIALLTAIPPTLGWRWNPASLVLTEYQWFSRNSHRPIGARLGFGPDWLGIYQLSVPLGWRQPRQPRLYQVNLINLPLKYIHSTGSGCLTHILIRTYYIPPVEFFFVFVLSS